MGYIDNVRSVSQLERIVKSLNKKHNEAVISTAIENDELTILVNKKNLIEVLMYLRDSKDCLFRVMVDICGVDYPEREERFEVVYHMLSLNLNLRVRVKTSVAEDDSVPSACELFSSANWYEREAYDMFGIKFENHPDLRRILTDYGFSDFPLRKDFPVEGKTEVYYDEDEKRVMYKKLDAPQEFRNFDDISPWSGMAENINLSDDDSSFSEKDFG